MARASGQGPFPGAVRQVVADLEVAMGEWRALGVGPWTVLEIAQRGGEYRGEACDALTAIGFSHIGPMQIELIEARDDNPSIWREARESARFGPHHIASWADDFDRTMGAVARTELAVVQSGDGNGMARFAYLESPSRGLLVEIMELNDISRFFMDDIATYCETWDGAGEGVRR